MVDNATLAEEETSMPSSFNLRLDPSGLGAVVCKHDFMKHRVASALMMEVRPEPMPPAQIWNNVIGENSAVSSTADGIIYAAAAIQLEATRGNVDRMWTESDDVLPRAYRATVAAHLPCHKRKALNHSGDVTVRGACYGPTQGPTRQKA